MSGRSLFPLTISLASRLASEFNGDLQISYSGGARFLQCGKNLKSRNSTNHFCNLLS